MRYVIDSQEESSQRSLHPHPIKFPFLKKKKFCAIFLKTPEYVSAGCMQ